MKKQEYAMSNIDEADTNEISRLIREGYTSGRIDNGKGKCIAWELKLDVWNDNTGLAENFNVDICQCCAKNGTVFCGNDTKTHSCWVADNHILQD